VSRFVVFYEPADDVLTVGAPHMPAHSAHVDAAAQRGDLLAVGVFEDPQRHGSMCVLVSREAAERFVREDPFVVHGVVRSHRILEWHDILA
jgi:uncharacterized protein YciI